MKLLLFALFGLLVCKKTNAFIPSHGMNEDAYEMNIAPVVAEAMAKKLFIDGAVKQLFKELVGKKETSLADKMR
jgi:hypothetical protein